MGLKSEAVPYAGESGTDAKLDYLALQVDALRGKLETLSTSSELSTQEPVPRWAYAEAMRRRAAQLSDISGTDTHEIRSKKDRETLLGAVSAVILKNAPKEIEVTRAEFEGPNDLVIEYVGEWNHESLLELGRMLTRTFGVRAIFERMR